MNRDSNEKNPTAVSFAGGPGRQGPRLVADIGGTNARFALETSPQCFKAVTVLPCNAYPRLQDAVAVFLASPEAKCEYRDPIRHAALAIANPVDGDVVGMTNHHWLFSIEALRAELGLETLTVVNDFTALAMALPVLSADQKIKIGGGAEQRGHAIGLVGAGTGLGVSGIIPAGEHWIPLHSEGRARHFLQSRVTNAKWTSCVSPGANIRMFPPNACCRAWDWRSFTARCAIVQQWGRVNRWTPRKSAAVQWTLHARFAYRPSSVFARCWVRLPAIWQ